MKSTVSGSAVLLGALVLFGGVGPCGDVTGLPGPDARIRVAFDDDLDQWPRDGWDLRDAVVRDDSLELTVSYPGGCRAHRFWLLAVDGFQSLPDAGPTPTVAVPILLAHDADGDGCEAYITRAESFDLQPLRRAFQEQVHPGPGRIILHIPLGQGSADTTAVDFVFQ